MIAYISRLIFPLMRPGALGMLATLAMAAVLGLAACGYHMEGEYLPDNLSTISIGAVKNRTFTGELDVRLKHELRRRLSRNPNLRLVGPARGELRLDIELTSAKFARALDVSDTDLSSLSLGLRGRMIVNRTDAQPRLVRTRNISVRARLQFDQPVIETPAVRDEVMNDAIILFAKKVESALYSNF